MFNRCANDIFKYCKVEPKLTGQILEKQFDKDMVRFGGVCEYNPMTCENAVTHTDFWKPLVDKLDEYKSKKEETK